MASSDAAQGTFGCLPEICPIGSPNKRANYQAVQEQFQPRPLHGIILIRFVPPTLIARSRAMYWPIGWPVSQSGDTVLLNRNG
jgi:hypothetical protein